MNDTDILLNLVSNGVCLWAGYRWGLFTAARRIVNRLLENPRALDEDIKAIERLREEIAAEAQEPKLDKIRRVRVEREGTEVYLYAEDNGEFLAQGPSLEVALERVKERYPTQKFAGLLSAQRAQELGIKAD